ncbi:RICIN domain-containing protein [Kitasatospora purpeofusca]|uniref:RICIN domain-containing protein n=1 Tax=Kitasatospora purpeofusca TaxID=67352 RepID=UPI0035E3A201
MSAATRRPTRTLAALVLAFASALLLFAAPQASAAGPVPGPFGTVCDPYPVRFQSPYDDWGKPADPRITFPRPIQSYGPTYLSTHPYKTFDPDRPFRRYQAELLANDWGGHNTWNICRGEGPSVYLTAWGSYECLTASDPVKYPNDEVTANGCVNSDNMRQKFQIHTNAADWSVIQDERSGYFLDAVRTTYRDEVYGTVWIYTLKLSADNALAFRMV